jgi:hypothetical protein
MMFYDLPNSEIVKISEKVCMHAEREGTISTLMERDQLTSAGRALLNQLSGLDISDQPIAAEVALLPNPQPLQRRKSARSMVAANKAATAALMAMVEAGCLPSQTASLGPRMPAKSNILATPRQQLEQQRQHKQRQHRLQAARSAASPSPSGQEN